MIDKNFSSSIDRAIQFIKNLCFDFIEKLISLHKSFSYFSIVVFLPLFISISLETNNLISLDRSIWIAGKFQTDYSGLNLTPYLITFPFSLILVTLFAIKFFSRIIINKPYKLTICWILFILIINFISGNVSS